MKPFLAAAVAFGFGLAVVADEPKAADDVKKQAIEKALASFSGTWEITSAKPEGITKDARSLVFRKDMTYAALDKDGKELWAGTFDLDPTASPKVWDHRSHESRKKGGDALGIYELDGDILTVACVVAAWVGKEWRGRPRPTCFTLPDADVVLELRRVKGDK
jgi:uncharacterized protein (TIGR03067 family)